MIRLLLRSALLLLVFFVQSLSAEAQTRRTMGWVEKVKIFPEDVLLQAKLDTGAENSSLDAENIEEFEKDGKKWVRFELINRFGKTVVFEKKVVSVAKIKTPRGKAIHRPVVRFGLCLGDQYMEAEVNLQNRDGYDYQMLIGRSFLAGNIIVDPAIMYTAEPNCTKNQ